MPLCLAADLSDYPDFFYRNGTFDLAIVTNKKQSSDHTVASVNMIFSLPNSKGLDNLFDNQIKEINRDMILVGNPCQNTITKQLFGDDCTLGLKKGEGLIQYMNKDGNDIVLIAAIDDEDLITVSEQVRNNPEILKGEKVIIKRDIIEEIEEYVKGICEIDGITLEEGEVGSLNGKPVYCSSEGLKEQKNNGEECSINSECFTGKCIEGKCGEEGFWVRIWNWIKGLF